MTPHHYTKACILTFLLLSTSAWADLTMNLETEISGEKSPSIMMISAKGMRIEQQQGAMILPANSHQMLMIDNSEKTVMVMQIPAQASEEAPTTTPPKVIKTGKKENISGFDCEQFEITDSSGNISELWISPKGPDMQAFVALFKGMESLSSGNPHSSMDWMKAVLSNKELSHFPILTITDSCKSTLLSFNTDPIAESEFAPPAGYQKVSLPSFSGMPQRNEGESSPDVSMEMIKSLQKNAASQKGLTPEQIKLIKDAAKRMSDPQQ